MIRWCHFAVKKQFHNFKELLKHNENEFIMKFFISILKTELLSIKFQKRKDYIYLLYIMDIYNPINEKLSL